MRDRSHKQTASCRQQFRPIQLPPTVGHLLELPRRANFGSNSAECHLVPVFVLTRAWNREQCRPFTTWSAEISRFWLLAARKCSAGPASTAAPERETSATTAMAPTMFPVNSGQKDSTIPYVQRATRRLAGVTSAAAMHGALLSPNDDGSPACLPIVSPPTVAIRFAFPSLLC